MPSEHWNGLPYDSTLGDAFDYEPPLSISNQWRLFHKTDRQIVQEALDLLRIVSDDNIDQYYVAACITLVNWIEEQ